MSETAIEIVNMYIRIKQAVPSRFESSYLQFLLQVVHRVKFLASMITNLWSPFVLDSIPTPTVHFPKTKQYLRASDISSTIHITCTRQRIGHLIASMDLIQAKLLNPLHPYLTPITSSLPTPINDAIITLLGAPCHSALLLDLDITSHPECLSLAISKALGIAIITAASIVKIPQIIKLVRSRSAAGLSFPSYLLESASFLITLAYNIRSAFPFSTYGESALILAQDVVISVLILQYQNKSAAAATFVAAVAAGVYALIVSDTLVSTEQMKLLQGAAGILSIASKLPQIATVYTQGGTGQLSAFAVFNYLLGSASRIFTTLQEVDDKLILYSFIAGFVLNAVLAAQMVYYWNSPATARHAAEADTKAVKFTVGQDGKAGMAMGESKAVASGEEVQRPGSSSGRVRRRG
jgi:mannose-P-dolichol utilization defect protein 1